jgi:AraC-like DNA-binding protein
MDKLELYIDNMVCSRCTLTVRRIADELGWRIHRLELGQLAGWPPPGMPEQQVMQQLTERLRAVGFRVRRGAGGISSRIKGLIIEYVYDDSADDRLTLSELVSSNLQQSYSHLSRLFTRQEGRTISEFYRIHRMERGKQLLAHTDQQVSTIAYRLHYGSLARFTAAFKRATGLSPTEFRERGDYRPVPLDEL